MAKITGVSKKRYNELEKENAVLQARLEASEDGNRWIAIAPLISKVISWVGLCVIVYFVYLMVDSLAGKVTYATIFANVLANIYVSHAIAVILAGGGVTYGVLQKKQKSKSIERLHSRIKTLELVANPDRTSSGLTTRGETNPSDRL